MLFVTEGSFVGLQMDDSAIYSATGKETTVGCPAALL